MKKVIKVLVIVIAIGAAVQTVMSIASADPHVNAHGAGEPGI
jgi:hypothetical protein